MEEKSLFDKEFESTMENYSIPVNEGMGMYIGNCLWCAGTFIGLLLALSIVGIQYGAITIAFSYLVAKSVTICENIGLHKIEKALENKEVGDLVESLINRQIGIANKELKSKGYVFTKDKPKAYDNLVNTDGFNYLLVFINKDGKVGNFHKDLQKSLKKNFFKSTRSTLNFRGYVLDFTYDTTEIFKIYCYGYAVNKNNKKDCGEVIFELPPPNVNEIKSLSMFKNIDFGK